MSKRSLARFAAFFLASEDPQRRLDCREVVTLAHQVSLVRHILDTPDRRRVLVGDEVGLGKTVVAGLIIQELLATNPGLRVLYLAPARLVSNVGRELKRMSLFFREWKAADGDARLETDSRIIASIHRAVHPSHFNTLLKLRPWDLIVVDECHHLSDWGEGGGDPGPPHLNLAGNPLDSEVWFGFDGIFRGPIIDSPEKTATFRCGGPGR